MAPAAEPLRADGPGTFPEAWARGRRIALGPPVRGFEHAELLGARVTLHEDAAGGLWIVYPAGTYQDQDGGPGPFEMRAERLWFWNRGIWPGPATARCHTGDPSHPWNQDPRTPPGFHRCGACGFPAWLESHGNASGHCERCGHEG